MTIPPADRGYGVLLAIGLLLGLVVGIAAGEPSIGVVAGLGVGALAALGLRVRDLLRARER
jgi:hypothetical protein